MGLAHSLGGGKNVPVSSIEIAAFGASRGAKYVETRSAHWEQIKRLLTHLWRLE